MMTPSLSRSELGQALSSTEQKLRSLIAGKLGCHAQSANVDDIVQATYLLAISKPELHDIVAAQQDDPTNKSEALTRWVCEIARLKTLEFGRNRSRAVPHNGVEVSTSEEPSTILAMQEEAEFLQKLLMRLAVDEREVLTMYFLQGMKAGEIARILGISSGAALLRRGRALEKLHKLVNEAKVDR
jgi:RNA polymerase sigma factor (sigma-70 family)